ncbi:MAG: NAD(+) synthase [Candidatus Omnitrophota bacterium]
MEKKIAAWIKKQVKTAKAKGIIMGLSGGLDSSVVAALSKKAVGKNLLCLIMPCHSHKKDLNDARLVARKFKLNTKVVDLCKIYDSFIKLMSKADAKTKGNLKARLRMVALYYFANKFNYLVAGTGNKSEISIGYFTKHGDAAVDILPIGCLLKNQVRNLARSMNIPKRIIDKSPSAGLWANQTDEKEIGMSYKDLDSVLSGKKKPVDRLKKVKKLIAKTEHKRKPPEICYI